MAEKRKYTEVLASIETHIQYISNHLANIDSHLEKQNTRLGNHDILITRNSTNIKWLIKSMIFLFGGSGATAGILKLLGIY